MMSLRELTEEYLGSLKYVREIPRRFELSESADIIALVGPRRVGKTFTFLKKVKRLLDEGLQALYVPFDEPSLRDVGVREFAELVRKEFPNGRVYLFLDEVQEWREWDFNLRWLHDVKDFIIYVSGSSSALMSSEIPSRLRGRYVSKTLYPLAFSEVVDFDVRTFRERGRVRALLEEYMRWGGFPEVWVSRSREKITSLLDTMFYRDMVERFRVRDIEVFRRVLYHVLANYANFITYRGLRRFLKGVGVSVDVKTVMNYVSYMRQAFLIFINELYTPSRRRMELNPKKIYVVDQSLITLFPKSKDEGRIMENITYLELLRRREPMSNIYYYRTRRGEEVDFLITRQGHPSQLIEVTHTLEPEHLRKVRDALQELRLREAIIITREEEEEIKEGKHIIKVTSLWKWLLGLS